MDISKLVELVERLQKGTIGDPNWDPKRGVFEFPRESVEVAVVLKLIRVVQGLHAEYVLCKAGLFVDMGAIHRCVMDGVAEVEFLIENYPATSKHVDRFLGHFFAQKIDQEMSESEAALDRKKVVAAQSRLLAGGNYDSQLLDNFRRVNHAFSGYVHAGYSHIMQMYGGAPGNKNFNLSGIPSDREKIRNMRIVEAAYGAILPAIGMVAFKFGHKEIHGEVLELC